MSIAAGRAYVVMTAALVALCLVWFGLAWVWLEPWSQVSVIPAVIGLTAAVGLVVGLLMFGRFVDVTVGSTAITIRRVLGSQQEVSLSEVDHLVVLESVILPGLYRATASERVIVLRDGRVITAFTPHGAFPVRRMQLRGIEVEVIPTALTAWQAHRRYRGAVSRVELLLVPTLWAFMIAAIVAVIWVLA